TKIDPTIINGGVLNSFNSSARLGNSNWSILELDESDGSFLEVLPTYSIITNIDREHMDYYKTMDNLKELFKKFLEKVPSFGKSFICNDDKINREIIKKLKNKNFYTYGTKYNSNFQINNILQNKNFSKFNLKILMPGKKKFFIKNIKIPILGMHNIRNTTAAIAVAITIGISSNIIKKGLSNFKGVQRRFNKIFTFKGVDYYDDYAHHPSEIKEVLNGVRTAYKKKKIVCIFQPHRISRLRDLKKDFTLSFKNSDQVILCPIFAAGEKMKLGFNYYDFAKDIAKNSKVELFLVKDKNNLARFIKQNIHGNKIVIGMGAGSISNWVRDLPNLV
ncbi:UDP-N-acetylmuramate--L-alanine ligase, partial [Pelagibacterales bacterium SAG-MED15]|nr:UDP-N-acetylmuramate--L-alanine ligase [Pelagibacterales bacterium SAG-MED15]